MDLSIVAAMDEKRGVGKFNKLPWSISAEMDIFRSLTRGENNVIVMGRKTYESIGKPLPGRINIVLSRTLGDCVVEGKTAPKLVVSSTFEDAMAALEKRNVLLGHIFVIGGQSIYEQFIDQCRFIYLSKIHHTYDCDRFFPEFSNFKVISKTDYPVHPASQNSLGEVSFTHYVFERFI